MDKVRNYVGLYYPYIHFRDEAWLKSTLLYWDRMRRIVPEADVDQAQRGDSATVRQLEAEGFVEDVIPVQQMNAVGKDFLQLIERHGDQLVERYGIVAPSTRGVERRGQIAESWQGTRPRPGADPALSYVYYGLHEQLEGFPQVVARFLDRVPLTGDVLGTRRRTRHPPARSRQSPAGCASRTALSFRAR